MLAFVIALLAIANLGYAVRALFVALRSGPSLHVDANDTDAVRPRLSIIVPARNEERQIERCVRSLLAQRYGDFEVIVVDDCSTDATRAILRCLAAENPPLRIVDGAPLPEGWVGKPWALVQGAAIATGDWLLFTDADTIHEPDAARSAVDFARSHNDDALSLLTDQVLVTLGERACLPTILWTIGFAVGSVDDINDPKKREVAIFNGQFILITRYAYDALGGHAIVKDEIAEDLEFARAFKRDGRFRGALIGANGFVRTRMYQSFSELWNGFVKNFALGARDNMSITAFAIVFLACISPLAQIALLYALVVKAFSGAVLLSVAMLAATAAAELGMRRMRFPAWSGLWLRIGTAVLLAILLTSMFRHRFGSVTWRGRRYGGERGG